MLASKIRDYFDTSVAMVILMDNIEQYCIMREVLGAVGLDRCYYKYYECDDSSCLLELRLPYNRYLAMMLELTKRAWTLKAKTNVGIFNTMVKIDAVKIES